MANPLESTNRKAMEVMGFMDFVKGFVEVAAKDASRSCERIERKYGSRMSQEQLGRVRDRKSRLDSFSEWASNKRK